MEPSPRSDTNNCTSQSEGMSTNGRQDRQAGFWRLHFVLYKLKINFMCWKGHKYCCDTL